MNFFTCFFSGFWLGLGDWNKKENATLTQVMRPSNKMFNLYDNVTVEFSYRYPDVDRRFYYQFSETVGITNNQGHHDLHAVCEWTNETEVLVNSKELIDSAPSHDGLNNVCYSNLEMNDHLACKQR